MKLLTLTLDNFKGIKHFELNTNGHSVNVYGSNGTGKTTLMDAFTWLLFGKNSKDEKDFGIKTREDGVEIPKIDHTVSALVEHNGKQIFLQKVYKEKWRKARGAEKATYDGNTTSYFYGSANAPTPVTAAKYQSVINELIPEQLFKLLTDPLYFNEKLKWQERREILMKICGDIKTDDVLTVHPELAELPAITEGRPVEDVRIGLRANYKKVGKEREEVGPRVDECRNGLYDVTPTQNENAITDLNTLPGQISEERAKLAELMAKGKESANEAEKSALQNKLYELQQERKASDREKLGELKSAASDARTDYNQAESETSWAKTALDNATRDWQRVLESLNAIRAQYKATRNETYERKEINEVCPTCGQPLPPDRVEEARTFQDREEAAFNQVKAEKLKELNEEGKEAKVKADAAKAEAEEKGKALDAAKARQEEKQKAMVEAQAKVTAFTAAPESDEEKALKAKIEGLNSHPNATPELDAAIAKQKDIVQSLEDRADRAKEIVTKVQHNNDLNKRIQELLMNDKVLAEKQQDLERKLHLCDLFVRAKTEMVNDVVAEKFIPVCFTMFKANITNDGVEECCEASYLGVPYKDLNTGARVNAGLDVINALTQVYGESAPIFLDNAESVVKLIPTDAQKVRLVVSEPDKALRVEEA